MLVTLVIGHYGEIGRTVRWHVAVEFNGGSAYVLPNFRSSELEAVLVLEMMIYLAGIQFAPQVNKSICI